MDQSVKIQLNKNIS